jgi:hypothetical protein
MLIAKCYQIMLGADEPDYQKMVDWANDHLCPGVEVIPFPEIMGLGHYLYMPPALYELFNKEFGITDGRGDPIDIHREHKFLMEVMDQRKNLHDTVVEQKKIIQYVKDWLTNCYFHSQPDYMNDERAIPVKMLRMCEKALK